MGLSLNWNIDLSLLISHKAIKPFSLAEARIWDTYRFQDTDVIYEPSCGLPLPGLTSSGDVTSFPISIIRTSKEPKANKLFFKEFHYAHKMG